MKFYLECHINGKDQDSKSFMSLYLYKTGQTDQKFNGNFDCRRSVIQKSGNRVNTSTFPLWNVIQIVKIFHHGHNFD